MLSKEYNPEVLKLPSWVTLIVDTVWSFFWFCRKFSLEALCGMISLHDQRSIRGEQDDGDQFQRGPFPSRSHSHGCPLVCGVPAEHAPCGRTHGGTRGGGRSLHHQPMGHQI